MMKTFVITVHEGKYFNRKNDSIDSGTVLNFIIKKLPPCAYAHAIKRVILDGNYGSMSCDESQTKWAVTEYAQVLSFSLFLLSRFLRWCQPHTYHTPAFLILLIFKTTDVSPPYSSGDVDIVGGKGEQ